MTEKELESKIGEINAEMGIEDYAAGAFYLDIHRPGDTDKVYKICQINKKSGNPNALHRRRFDSMEAEIFLAGLVSGLIMGEILPDWM